MQGTVTFPDGSQKQANEMTLDDWRSQVLSMSDEDWTEMEEIAFDILQDDSPLAPMASVHDLALLVVAMAESRRREKVA